MKYEKDWLKTVPQIRLYDIRDGCVKQVLLLELI